MKRSKTVLCSLAVAVSTALAGSRAVAAMLPGEALHGKKVLFVAGEQDEKHPSDDELVKSHLKSMGFTVADATEGDPVSEADGMDLVVISSTANPYALKATFTDVPVPIFTWNQRAYPGLAMTGPHLHRTTKLLTASNSTQDRFLSFTDLEQIQLRR